MKNLKNKQVSNIENGLRKILLKLMPVRIYISKIISVYFLYCCGREIVTTTNYLIQYKQLGLNNIGPMFRVDIIFSVVFGLSALTMLLRPIKLNNKFLRVFSYLWLIPIIFYLIIHVYDLIFPAPVPIKY